MKNGKFLQLWLTLTFYFFLQVKRTEEEFLEIAYSDISQLCGELIVLWNNFINLFIGKSEISQHLARLHHHQKVKRFSEAFFLIGTFTKKSTLSGNTDQYYPFFQIIPENLHWIV